MISWRLDFNCLWRTARDIREANNPKWPALEPQLNTGSWRGQRYGTHSREPTGCSGRSENRQLLIHFRQALVLPFFNRTHFCPNDIGRISSFLIFIGHKSYIDNLDDFNVSNRNSETFQTAFCRRMTSKQTSAFRTTCYWMRIARDFCLQMVSVNRAHKYGGKFSFTEFFHLKSTDV